MYLAHTSKLMILSLTISLQKWLLSHPRRRRKMIKVYCDKCGKEVKYDDMYGARPVIEAAANGDDILFTVEVHALSKERKGPGNKYHYNRP